MKIPTVSVVMITYGHEKYIKEAINGIFMQQTYFPVELIIANDCSPDNTDKVVEKSLLNASENVIVKYTRHEKNLGMIPNFIWALQQCKGKYIALCEGDDYWTDPKKLQKQVDFMVLNPKYSMCFTSVKKYYQDKHIFKDWHIELKQKDYSANEIISNLLIPTCTAVFRNDNNDNFKNLFENKNFVFADMIMWLHLLEKGRIFCLPFESGVYRRNEGSVSGIMSLELQLRLLKQHEEIAISFEGKYKNLEKKYLSRQYLVASLKLLINKDLRYKEYFMKSIRKSIVYLPINILYVVSKFIKNDYIL